MDFLRNLFGAKQSPTSLSSSSEPHKSVERPASVIEGGGSSENITTIVSKAKEAPWNNQKDVVELRQAIKSTWRVSCQVLNLTEVQAKALAQQAPLDNQFRDIGDQYQIRLSANSIIIHAYGAFIDFGYVMFFYHDHLYYVNAEPTVKLTTSIYKRTDTLSQMAKIMIVLNDHIGAERKTLLIRLEGDLTQPS